MDLHEGFGTVKKSTGPGKKIGITAFIYIGGFKINIVEGEMYVLVSILCWNFIF